MKQRNRTTFRPNRKLLSCALASCLAMAAPQLMAQSTSATLRGAVTADATVTVTNVDTGLTRTAKAANGSYNIGGLPPGTYRIDVNAGGQTSSSAVTLAVGQTATLNLQDAPPVSAPAGDATTLDTVRVTAPMLVETKTSEVATYVSNKQIELLPQNSRNFLAFADLVPGMEFTVASGTGESQLRSGAQGANNINVYIDGVGQKNYVTSGGMTGQDDSRGNPFPQLAIGEYKVITSNYKAEYDQISSAAVTAVTKSGTNDFSGSFYWDRTSDAWRKPTPMEEGAGKKAEESTQQYGLAFGGPIIRDKLHFFVTYEAKDYIVPKFLAAPSAVVEAQPLPSWITSYYGPTSQPFKQEVYFGKLSWSANESNLFELSAKYRDEVGMLDVGGTRTESAATALVNDETRIDLRHQFTSMNWLNDAHITYEESAYNPSAVVSGPAIYYTVITPNQSNPNNNTRVLWTGAGTNNQDKGQKGWAIQDDLTWFGWEGHTLKMGVKYKQVDLTSFSNPPTQYTYDINDPSGLPYQLTYNAVRPGRSPNVLSENKQFGIYIQDDWEVNEKLMLNLGVRWDYERNPSFENYVLNPTIAATMRAYAATITNLDYNIEDYISNGNNRSAFKGAIQPRLGFSYDLFGDQRHVIFGGAGRAYDRNIFDHMAREFTAGSRAGATLNFATALHPCNSGRTCVPWNPALLTEDGIAAYLAANPINANGEVVVINNEIKTPYSDQFSLGMRNTFALWEHDWNSSVAVAHIRSYDGIYFAYGRRRPDGTYHQFEGQGQTYGNWPGNPAGQSNLLLGVNGFEYRTTSLLVSLDKPYTEASKWGINLAYTYSEGEENRPGSTNQNSDATYVFDYPWASNEFYDSTGVAKHRLVLSGIYSPGWDLIFSSKLILATPKPLSSINRLNSPAPNTCAPITGVASCNDLRAYHDPVTPDGTLGFKQLDLAVEKRWDTGTDLTFKVRADLLNAFNWRNWTSFNTNWGPAGGPMNPTVGSRNGNAILDPTRTFKLSFGFDW